MSAAATETRRYSKEQYALAHVKRGDRVFPLWWPRPDGTCACGNPQCESIAKHPLAKLAPNGVKDATSDPAVVRKWWSQYPLANIGRAPRDHELVLDVDPRHGGDDSLFELERQHGALPDTEEVLTPSGGRHLSFILPDGVKVRNAVGIAPGLDIRTEGGYVLAVGSVGANGVVYEYEGAHHPADGMQRATIPAWLLDLLRHNGTGAERPGVSVADVLDGVPEGQRDQQLFGAVLTLHRAGVPEAWALTLALGAAANCTPAYPAAKAREKVARLYGSYTPPPLPTVTDLDDPSEDCPRCAHFRETVAELRAELEAVETICRNKQLSTTDRVVGIAGIRRIDRMTKLGNGFVQLPTRALGAASGTSPATAGRSAQRLEEAGVWMLDKAPKTVPFVDRVSGHQRETEVEETRIKLLAPLAESMQALANAKPLEPRKHGGYRPRCKHHPAADVMKRTTWVCTTCGEVIQEEAETYAPPVDVFQVETPQAAPSVTGNGRSEEHDQPPAPVATPLPFQDETSSISLPAPVPEVNVQPSVAEPPLQDATQLPKTSIAFQVETLPAEDWPPVEVYEDADPDAPALGSWEALFDAPPAPPPDRWKARGGCPNCGGRLAEPWHPVSYAGGRVGSYCVPCGKTVWQAEAAAAS